MQTWLTDIKDHLNTALCIRDFPSQTVERHNLPEVEVKWNKELILPEELLTRSEFEKVLIEPSINSCRVSIRVKTHEALDSVLVDRFSHYMMRRAVEYIIIRKKAIDGYHLSLLFCNRNTRKLRTDQLSLFVTELILVLDKVAREIKVNVSLRANIVADEFVKSFGELNDV